MKPHFYPFHFLDVKKALSLFQGRRLPQMVEFFGEELFLQGTFIIHRLIWIQLLVFLLLLLLLLLLYSSSSSEDVILTPSVDTPLRSSTAACTTTTTAASSSSRHRQKKKLEEDSKLDRRKDGFDGVDSSGLTEVTHPCHIIRLARVAFLKCFGLGPPKDNPTRRELPPRR